jgi:hypothetical protein
MLKRKEKLVVTTNARWIAIYMGRTCLNAVYHFCQDDITTPAVDDVLLESSSGLDRPASSDSSLRTTEVESTESIL